MSLEIKRPVRDQIKDAVPGRVTLVDADLLCYITRDADEPLENVLHSVKLMLLDMQENTKCEHMRLILSNRENWRYEINHLYKASRKDKEKPVHYEATRQYLVDHWSAEVSPDKMEADDFCVQLRNDNPDWIVASLDKDFFVAKGLLYKWRGHFSGHIFEVTQEDADNFLAWQLALGDVSDTILSPIKAPLKSGKLGKTGYGKVKARDLLLQYDSAEERIQAVKGLYHEQGFSDEYEINLKMLDIGMLRW